MAVMMGKVGGDSRITRRQHSGIWYEFRDGRGRFGFEADDGRYYLKPGFFKHPD